MTTASHRERLETALAAAWRVRETLSLNLDRIMATGDPVLTKNLLDAFNDFCEHWPLSEDGYGSLLPDSRPPA